MEIREATEGDIPEIVALLKRSLGESLMPKSEQYWRWKHLENPFGPSPVLLCREGDALIGVRAFMRWEWIHRGQVYRAVRAVDTATHPDHQGKGIFKKLTLLLVEYCKERGDHFVFNTPNKQSTPGYLKMDWVEAGKLPIKISVQRPFRMLRNFISGTRPLPEGETTGLKYYLHHSELGSLVREHVEQTKTMSTNWSAAYLSWRYLDVPVARYVAIGEEQGQELTGLMIGRIKETRIGRELRMTDYFLKENNSGRELIRKLNERNKEWGIDYTTLSGTLGATSKKMLRGFSIKASVGPVVTTRSLRMTDMSMLKNFNQWSPSLGDLELF